MLFWQGQAGKTHFALSTDHWSFAFYPFASSSTIEAKSNAAADLWKSDLKIKDYCIPKSWPAFAFQRLYRIKLVEIFTDLVQAQKATVQPKAE